jgi:hypothetical protein
MSIALDGHAARFGLRQLSERDTQARANRRATRASTFANAFAGRALCGRNQLIN